jgi:hypothetical protein
VIKTAVAAAVLAVATASGANAATVLFSENFDSLPQALGTTSVPGLTVTTGTVDIVTNGNFGIDCAGNIGACLDIDGSPGPGAIETLPIAFLAGRQITISYDLSGNQRGAGDDEFLFTIAVGAPTDLLNLTCISGFSCPTTDLFEFTVGGDGMDLPESSPWTTYSLSFIPVQSGTLVLGFSSPSADNQGPLLDNLLVSQAVPEPASWAMLIAGFGLVGAAARRRRITVAA